MNYSQLYLSDIYLHAYQSKLIHLDKINKVKEEQAKQLDFPSLTKYSVPLEALPQFKTTHFNGLEPDIQIGSQNELTEAQHHDLLTVLQALKPWRKGPFQYFGTYIDSEWRSDLKWNRIQPMLDIQHKRVADVGCNNLYYMYKMLPYHPELVIGMEPLPRYFFYYLLNQRFIQAPAIKFELLGVEHLGLFESFFDTVLLLGILYHRRNPIQMLEDVHRSLKNHGQLILDSAGIPGTEPVCLIPEDRYLKAKGYWFLPTSTALVNMLKRTHFYDIEVFFQEKLEPGEQRQTEWVGTESLSDFLDTNHPEKTIEGYPAPYRIYIKAKKKPNPHHWKPDGQE